MKKLLGFAAVALVLLVVVLVARTLLIAPAPQSPPAAALPQVDAAAAAGRLAGALRIATVTHNERARVDWKQFSALHRYLERQFPKLHRQLERQTVSQYSLLYTWPGTDPEEAPILLLAHQDVVPVEPGTEGAWTHPPFAGAVAGGFVWGRGALDDKASLMAQLEAVEHLVGSGFRPRRTVYFAFGHDEEIGGEQGAVAIAKLLQARRVTAQFSLDEGGSLTRGVVAGIERPVASIMTGEKGYISFRLTTRDQGGHSSRPPAVTAVGRLARAVARLEQQPLPARLTPPVIDMLDRLAPEMPFAMRLAVANRWLFGPTIVRRLAASPIGNALVRTTTAPTMLQAGVKDNILPVEARAVVNFRVLPGESIDGLERHVRAIIGDPAVEIAREDFASEPSTVARTDTPSFALLERTVNEVFPEAVVTAGLVIGATDSRHYGAVRQAGYNFMPLTVTEHDLTRVHGADERVAVADYARAIAFYARLLQNAAGP